MITIIQILIENIGLFKLPEESNNLAPPCLLIMLVLNVVVVLVDFLALS